MKTLLLPLLYCLCACVPVTIHVSVSSQGKNAWNTDQVTRATTQVTMPLGEVKALATVSQNGEATATLERNENSLLALGTAGVVGFLLPTK